MARAPRPLTVIELKNLKDGTHAVGGVTGLYVRKRNGTGYYFLRYTNLTGRHDYTIGHINRISLAEARRKALMLHCDIEKGLCPVYENSLVREQKQAERRRLQEEKEQAKTIFENVAEQWIQNRVDSNYWCRNVRGEFNTRRQLEVYVYPLIGSQSINTVSPHDVLNCLVPIWQDKPNTAKKVKGTMFKVFQWAIAMGLRKNPVNPAAMDSALGVLLEPFSNARKPKENFAACPVNEIPRLYAELNALHSMSSRACQFCILTATRSKAVRFACWNEFDLENGIWNIPLEHDKIKTARRDRMIFLSKQAIELLKSLPHLVETELVFFSSKFNAFSDTALTMCLRGLHEKRELYDGIGWIDPDKTKRIGKKAVITMHGTARASFRTWAKSDELGNNRTFDQEAVELCLLHSKDDEYRGAYDRATLQKERQMIMQAWGDYCTSEIV